MPVISSLSKAKPHTLRSRAVTGACRVASSASIASLGFRLGPWLSWRSVRRYPWLKVLLRVNELAARLTAGRAGFYQEAVALLLANVTASIVDSVQGALAMPQRTVLHEDLVPPEILRAMGLHPWMAEFLGMVLPMVDPHAVEGYIDEAENQGIPADSCSLPKATLGLTLCGQMPRPRAVVTSNMPCDGGMMQYVLLERELGVPVFRLDVPHDVSSDRAVHYFAGELMRLIRWLERHTSARMDWDRLRAICEERNRAIEAELDLWDLLRARPAPLAAEPVYLTHLMYTVAEPGTPRGTRMFRAMLQYALRNHEAGLGALAEERHRAVLWNPPPMVFIDLFNWAERAHGVAMVMDMLTFHHHPFVDTRTPRSMLEDLARIIMQGPMARHTRGPAENFFGDLFHIAERFSADMIWLAGHVGCKNTQALVGMLRERCRMRRIPLLIIDYDLLDPRAVSPADIQGQVDRFMETVMGESRADFHGTREG
ncbi:MAG: 2-hydroxyacyl-CoA dehydratase [Bradymonadales bacterium]|nr:2-hydroxyacyl-CoA dehydratase [Bradymonadales bacterium]